MEGDVDFDEVESADHQHAPGYIADNGVKIKILDYAQVCDKV